MKPSPPERTNLDAPVQPRKNLPGAIQPSKRKPLGHVRKKGAGRLRDGYIQDPSEKHEDTLATHDAKQNSQMRKG